MLTKERLLELAAPEHASIIRRLSSVINRMEDLTDAVRELKEHLEDSAIPSKSIRMRCASLAQQNLSAQLSIQGGLEDAVASAISMEMLTKLASTCEGEVVSCEKPHTPTPFVLP